MKISSLNIFPATPRDTKQHLGFASYPSFSQLKQDTVSFKGVTQKVKKNDYKDFDYAVVEKFRVNISGFRTPQDLGTWIDNKINQEYTNKKYPGASKDTERQRDKILKEWSDYMSKEQEVYKPSIQLLVLESLTKELKTDNDILPPVLNKGVLAEVIENLQVKLKKNPQECFNFNKLYQTKLNASYVTDKAVKGKAKDTGWVIIKSKINDPEHFRENVKKMKTISHPNWCTSNYSAEPYLSEGDFHVYVEEGRPKLGVRFVGDTIVEIQGVLNDNKIPAQYLPAAQKHVLDNNYKINENTEQEFEHAELVSKEIKKIKKELGEDVIKNNDIQKILPYFGISVEKLPNKLYRISEYHQPDENFTFDDLGINENKLIWYVQEITGDFSLENSKLARVQKLEVVGGDVICQGLKNVIMNKLREIKGNARFVSTKRFQMNNLQKIGGNAIFVNTQIDELPKLESIGGYANFSGLQAGTMDALKHVGGKVFLMNSDIKSMKNLYLE